MARESHTVRSPSFSTGTRPDGECSRIAAVEVSSSRNGTSVSVNGAPVRLSASQGRNDQVDHFLVPMTISIFGLPFCDHASVTANTD